MRPVEIATCVIGEEGLRKDSGVVGGELDRDRHEQARTRPDRRAKEFSRRYADDGQRHVVDGERAAENAWVAAELALPIRVAQDDRFGLSLDAIVLDAEQPAERGLEAQQRKVVSRNDNALHESRLLARRDTPVEGGVRGEPHERLLRALKIAEHRVAE